MEDPEIWINVIRECRPLLMKKLDGIECARSLRLADTLSKSEWERLRKESTTEDALILLIDILLTKDRFWEPLLDYLETFNQFSVKVKLLETYQEIQLQLISESRIPLAPQTVDYQVPDRLSILKMGKVPPRNPHFTGRIELLQQLKACFARSVLPQTDPSLELSGSPLKPSQANTTVLVAFHGMGGVGKTQLAIEFAHRYKDDYPYIFWIMAEEISQIEATYRMLAHDLKIDTQQQPDAIVRDMKTWFDRHPGCLLVYDNASSPEVIYHYLPETGHVLVTSRTTQWHWLGKSIAVDVFTAEEARVYFQELLGDLFESSSLEILAQTLGYLPLALAQAGAYMKRQRMSPSRYLVLYKKDKKRLLASKFLPPDYPEPVFVTWDITMQAIQKESHLAPAILKLCACLNSTNIPNFLLDGWVKQESNNPDQEIFEEALGTLGDYSMLTISLENESVSIHCLVQEVIRLKWTVNERRQHLQSAIDLASNCSPYEHETREDFTKTQRLLPHSEVLLGCLNECLGSFESNHIIPYLLKILKVLAAGYYITKNSRKQCEVLERALAIREKYYGSDHPEMAAILNNLGDAYGDLGVHNKQREMLERALLICEKHYKLGHPHVATTWSNLAMAYGNMGDYVKQKELLERALQIRQNHYGPDHAKVAITLNNLGLANGNLGEYKKQRELLERALPILEMHNGPDHPDVATTLNNLGVAYGNVGEHNKQLEPLQRALTIRKKHYGRDHPAVASTLNNLAMAYRNLGEYVKQRELLEQALPIYERHYGSDHPSVVTTLSNLGLAYGNLGDYVKKRELLEQALRIEEKHYGPDHPEVAITLNSLSVAYLNLGQYKWQRELLERALKIGEKHYGLDHPMVSTTLANLGMAYGNFGQYVKQRELLERALAILEKHNGPDHPDVAITLNNLGMAYGNLGEYVKQRELQEKGLQIREKRYGPDSPEVATTLNNLSVAYLNLGQYERQRELLERALQIRETHYGLDHLEVATILNSLTSKCGLWEVG